ncbi:hypothetical protein N665_0162s0037 [Sinapis alba]|nr:hypothetical protein N665_0162s0037 [Sinapis alba]
MKKGDSAVNSRRNRAKSKSEAAIPRPGKPLIAPTPESKNEMSSHAISFEDSSLGKSNEVLKGECSSGICHEQRIVQTSEVSMEAEPDSSDMDSADMDHFLSDEAASVELHEIQFTKELVSISSSQWLSDLPWLVLGDFNQTLDPQKHSPLRSLNVDGPAREFRDCFTASELSDLTLSGNIFTWWNKCGTTPVAKKLNRVLSSEAWSVAFPSSFADFGDPDFSDHSPCGVNLVLSQNHQKKPFKFYNMLLQNEDFLPLVLNHWFSCNVVGSVMYRVCRKLKLLKLRIREFSRANFSDLEKRVAEAHKIMLHRQQVLLASH